MSVSRCEGERALSACDCEREGGCEREGEGAAARPVTGSNGLNGGGGGGEGGVGGGETIKTAPKSRPAYSRRSGALPRSTPRSPSRGQKAATSEKDDQPDASRKSQWL